MVSATLRALEGAPREVAATPALAKARQALANYARDYGEDDENAENGSTPRRGTPSKPPRVSRVLYDAIIEAKRVK